MNKNSSVTKKILIHQVPNKQLRQRFFIQK
jgi:hypothetical protein